MTGQGALVVLFDRGQDQQQPRQVMATIDQADIRGRNRIIMIRREQPLTTDASPAKPVANFRRGFSFVLAPAAADLVLELKCLVQGFCFFPGWKGFCFCLFMRQ